METTRRTYGADGSVYDQARYIILEWDLSANPTTYVALLTLFGVQNNLYANVTIYAPDERLAYARMNGIAVRPQPGVDMVRKSYFPRDIRILIKDLAASA